MKIAVRLKYKKKTKKNYKVFEWNASVDSFLFRFYIYRERDRIKAGTVSSLLKHFIR